jgi:hypothetical protein
MSFFKKLFSKSDELEHSSDSETPISSADNYLNFPMAKSEEELTEMFAGIGMDRQRNVPEVIGDRSWGCSMDTRILSFGNDIHVPFQVLGTFSHSSETWLWAWANEKSNVPQELQEQAFKLKKYGEESGIQLLSVGHYDSNINEIHLIGSIASGMFGSSCYYIANFGQGSMLMTIKSKEFEIEMKEEFIQIRTQTLFPELISTFDMNHKNAFKYYVQAKGYTISENENIVTANLGANGIKATFDEMGRMLKMESKV